MVVLVFNPGSNSLKYELVETCKGQSFASDGRKIAGGAIDGVEEMSAAVREALQKLGRLESVERVGVRVVHGGGKYAHAMRVTEEVRRDIEAFEELAPLHNRSSLDVMEGLRVQMPDIPVYVTFDTAFHASIPEVAWRYPINREVADRHGVRKFGFHGVSHRYMVEEFAKRTRRKAESVSLVTTHLESGASACAVRAGRSVDTTMGFTPLEGLMMGSRSGSVDPAIMPFLMQREGMSANDVLTLLNKRSGFKGLAGELDTRVLEKRCGADAQLAMAMFAYRVRMAVGAYLAALGDAQAVLLGGGIGEDSPWLRKAVCDGLQGWGVTLDEEANRSTEGMVRVSAEGSRLEVWAMPVDEALQIAHECVQSNES